MSRIQLKPSKRQKAGHPDSKATNDIDDRLIAEARARFGSQAPAAFAYCALDAWFENEEDDYRHFAELFRRSQY